MKTSFLFLLLLVISIPSFGQDNQSTQPGRIAMHIIPKGADLEDARKLLQAMGESMKSAEGCIAVYTSEGGIAGPFGPTDYLMIQTIHWKSDMDFFGWIESDSGKITEEWGDLMKKMNIELFSYQVDNSLN